MTITGVCLVWPGNCVESADRTNDTKTTNDKISERISDRKRANLAVEAEIPERFMMSSGWGSGGERPPGG